MKTRIICLILFLLLGITFMPTDGISAGISALEPESEDVITGDIGVMMKILNHRSIYESLSEYMKGLISETFGKEADKESEIYTVTEEEFNILCRIVEAEATDGTIEQKMNVASCVLSRVESPEFPDTIKKVVFEKKQFSPISDGRYYSVKVQKSTKKAVKKVLKHGKTHNYLYFCAYYCKSSWFAEKDRKLAAQGKECYKDGMHRYYED